MGIISEAKQRLGFQSQEYRYECNDCGKQFESAIPGEALVRCSKCGSENQTKLGEVE